MSEVFSSCLLAQPLPFSVAGPSEEGLLHVSLGMTHLLPLISCDGLLIF